MRILSGFLLLAFAWCIPAIEAQQGGITLTTGSGAEASPTAPGAPPIDTSTGISETNTPEPGAGVSVEVLTVISVSTVISVQTVTASPTLGFNSSSTGRPTSTLTRIVPPLNPTTINSAGKPRPPSLRILVGSTVIGIGLWFQCGT